MKKELTISVISLISMVLFTAGTTFLYFQKREQFEMRSIYETEPDIQLAFDNYHSFLYVTDITYNNTKYEAKEEYSADIKVRYKNQSNPGNLKIIYNGSENILNDVYIVYTIFENDNVLKTDVLFPQKKYSLYEIDIASSEKDYTYNIKMEYYANDYQNKQNYIVDIFNKLSVEIE